MRAKKKKTNKKTSFHKIYLHNCNEKKKKQISELISDFNFSNELVCKLDKMGPNFDLTIAIKMLLIFVVTKTLFRKLIIFFFGRT